MGDGCLRYINSWAVDGIFSWLVSCTEVWGFEDLIVFLYLVRFYFMVFCLSVFIWLLVD